MWSYPDTLFGHSSAVYVLSELLYFMLIFICRDFFNLFGCLFEPATVSPSLISLLVILFLPLACYIPPLFKVLYDLCSQWTKCFYVLLIIGCCFSSRNSMPGLKKDVAFFSLLAITFCEAEEWKILFSYWFWFSIIWKLLFFFFTSL